MPRKSMECNYVKASTWQRLRKSIGKDYVIR